MLEYPVEALIGVGPVRLGMSRAQSRCAMGLTPDPFQKGSSPILTDAYHDAAFQVFFDADDKVEYIELSSHGPFVVTFKAVLVFELPAEDLVAFIAKDTPFDPDDWELGYSYIFPELELSLWRPTLPESDQDEDSRYFRTIGIGRRGYYSDRSEDPSR